MSSYTKYRKSVRWFDSKELHEDLKGKSIKGGISTAGSQFTRFGLNLISTFILARILLPEDFGVIGMVTAFTGFASIIQDMGLSMAVIQKQEINHRQISKLFWINILICFAIAVLFGMASPLIVALYNHDTRLYPIILAYALGIWIGGFGIQHNALMSRKMLFTHIAKANIYSTFLSVILGISAALMNWGYWSIVVLNLSAIALNTVFLWIFCNWRPSMILKKQRVREFLHFGAGISGFNIVNYVTRYSDNVLIGARIGATAVGYYTKAYQLLLLPLNQLRNPLMSVAIPAMSRLRNEPEKYISYYRKYIFLLAFFSMPLVTCLALFSKEVILIVLGPHWVDCSRIFQIFAILGFIDAVSSSTGLVMISSGQIKKIFIIGCITSSVTIAGFFIGIHWGIIGVATSFVVSTYLLLVPVLYFSYKNTPIKLSHFTQEIILPILHTSFMFFVLLVLRHLSANYLSPLLSFTLLLPAGLVIYYLTWKIYPFGRKKLANIEDLVKIVLVKFEIKLGYLNKNNRDKNENIPLSPLKYPSVRHKGKLNYNNNYQAETDRS